MCSVTVMQTLYAYPIAGSQSGFISIPLIIVVIVCLGDFFVWYESRRPIAPSPILRVALALMLFCVPAYYLLTTEAHRKTYDLLVPLGLPGAERIHVPATQARYYHWLVQNIEANCDIFFGMPELPSLHIWTGIAPPAGLATDDWIHQNMDTLPLARYLHENFKVVGSLDDFSLLVRNDRQIVNISLP